ncbi:MAG: YidC/Oxa1 family membrane protein insertase [Chloroflexi bacterium]|nr:YidC/Oxa1 family membrane protein insertase [Chloroflexota bacterium]
MLVALLGLLVLALPGVAQSPAVVPTTAPQSAAPTAAAPPTAAPATPAPITPAPITPAPATASPVVVTPAPAASVVPTPAASGGLIPGVSPVPTESSPPCPNPTPTPTPVPPTVAPGQSPVVTPVPTPDPSPAITPHPNLCPAQFGAAPWELAAWAFTPVFQTLFMGLVFFYNLFHDIGLAIIALTIVIRLLLVPLFRKQIVSQRRMQMIQPEMRAIQLKYKGNRAKISEEQMKLYKERGVNPAAGCLPALLQMLLLLPMYQVFSQGLSAPDISSMLSVFGQPVLSVECYDPTNPLAPCIDPSVPWLAWLPQITANGLEFYPGGLPANLPEIFIMVLPGLFGLSLLALASAALQLVQTRMMMTNTDDPQQRSQQRIFLILPLFSLIYGWFLPAGLFIYWITTTVFSIVQQYLINGWGGLFPLFGWTPGFAVNHQPRFPVPPPTPRPDTPASSSGSSTGTPSASARKSTTDSAAGTIRPAKRSSRRGRRR